MDEQTNTATPPPEPPPSRRFRFIDLTMSFILGAALAALGSFLIDHGSGSSPASATAAPSPAATQIGVSGYITISDISGFTDSSGASFPEAGDHCEGAGGYSDISAGTAVTIGNSAGTTLGTGALGTGTVTSASASDLSCQLPFEVDVPGGQSEYTVTISHRGTQVFTPTQVEGAIQLTLGN